MRTSRWYMILHVYSPKPSACEDRPRNRSDELRSDGVEVVVAYFEGADDLRKEP